MLFMLFTYLMRSKWNSWILSNSELHPNNSFVLLPVNLGQTFLISFFAVILMHFTELCLTLLVNFLPSFPHGYERYISHLNISYSCAVIPFHVWADFVPISFCHLKHTSFRMLNHGMPKLNHGTPKPLQ